MNRWDLVDILMDRKNICLQIRQIYYEQIQMKIEYMLQVKLQISDILKYSKSKFLFYFRQMDLNMDRYSGILIILWHEIKNGQASRIFF